MWLDTQHLLFGNDQLFCVYNDQPFCVYFSDCGKYIPINQSIPLIINKFNYTKAAQQSKNTFQLLKENTTGYFMFWVYLVKGLLIPASIWTSIYIFDKNEVPEALWDTSGYILRPFTVIIHHIMRYFEIRSFSEHYWWYSEASLRLRIAPIFKAFRI